MSWTATQRFGARLAPGGLALVQELVNTHAVARGDGQDLLAEHDGAQVWLEATARQWARSRGLRTPDPALSGTGLRALRELRTIVQDLLADPPDPPDQPDPRPTPTAGGALPGASATIRRARADLVSDRHGRVGLAPVGTGAGWLESAVWSEILLAQVADTWSRLKLCREPGCRSAFYDTSRNGSGVWHNVRSCGNIANLRAARIRKRSPSAAPDGADAPAPVSPALPGRARPIG